MCAKVVTIHYRLDSTCSTKVCQTLSLNGYKDITIVADATGKGAVVLTQKI